MEHGEDDEDDYEREANLFQGTMGTRGHQRGLGMCTRGTLACC